ncbi:uncharacterized protein LOC133779056 [Humulus lupulus]|uniref:uncharacterized protein LOC133779056 n=1 Tax=Humulus lupulus TaxID=3486 RepID=UPI002B405A94|nr:uncharacterized protein LOC133779056 [Humulus lupulus]
MVAYLERVRSYLEQLVEYSIEQIPRERNTHVDALAKLASPKDGDTLELVPVEYLPRSSIVNPDVHMASFPKESWASPIIDYLKDGVVPTDKREARRLVYKAARYTLVDGILYKRGYSVPLLRCVDEEEAVKVLYEIHEGECGNHASGPSTARKDMRQGFGVPYKIISDNGTEFEGETFEEYCRERDIRRSFSAVVHPQVNGQVEAINKVLKRNLKTKLEKMKGAWVEELPNVLWAYRTTPCTTTGDTPFSLAYGCEAVLPIEKKVNSYRIQAYEDQVNHVEMAGSLDLLEERRENAQTRVAVMLS